MRDAGLHGYIDESAVAIIAKQMRSRFAPWRKAFQSRSVHQKNVEPAVVVVIVEGNAAAGGFQQILVLVLAAEDGFRVQARFAGDIEKADAQIVILDLRCAFRWLGILLRRGRLQPARTSHREHALEREHKRGTAEKFHKSAALREQ